LGVASFGAAPAAGFLFFSAFGFRFSLLGRIEPFAMTTPLSNHRDEAGAPENLRPAAALVERI
jgi:hypothetical protein